MQINDVLKETPAWRVGSVAKAFRLLSLFTESEPCWNLVQIATAFGQPKSTTLNMLRTLEECGMLIKDNQTQTYRLGLACMNLGYRTRVSVPILHYATSFLEELQNATGKNIYLTIPYQGRVFYLESVFSSKRQIPASMEGKALPMHCTGGGKAMLSRMSRTQVERVIACHGLPKYTNTTITDRETLLEELEKTRKRGYAIDNGEESVGIRCVAVAIENSNRVLGSISVSGANIGMPDKDLPRYAEMISEITPYLAGKADLFPLENDNW